MATFGENLAREREARGITLDESSAWTKIPRRYLEALERDDFADLPGGAFSKGFVRSYAQFLGLEAEAVVEAFVFELRARGLATPDGDQELIRELSRLIDEKAERERQASDPASTLRRAALVLLPILALAAAASWFLLRDREGEPAAGRPTAPRPLQVIAQEPQEKSAATRQEARQRPAPPVIEEHEPADSPPPAPVAAAEIPAREDSLDAQVDTPPVAVPPSPVVSPPPRTATQASGAAMTSSQAASSPPPAAEPPSPAASSPPPATEAASPAAVPPPPAAASSSSASPPHSPAPAASRESSLAISESGLGTGIVNRRLVGQGDRFEEGTQVWFWTRTVGGQAGDAIRHVWIHEDRIRADMRLAVGGSHWRNYSRKTLRAGTVGPWRVEARDADDRVLATAEFTCVPRGVIPDSSD
jgi:cytoskeleton protein RodZ